MQQNTSLNKMLNMPKTWQHELRGPGIALKQNDAQSMGVGNGRNFCPPYAAGLIVK